MSTHSVSVHRRRPKGLGGFVTDAPVVHNYKCFETACEGCITRFQEFEHLFDPELGLVQNVTHTVKVRHTVRPMQSKLHRLPVPLRDAVSEEIFQLECLGVIERISAWELVSPIVVVRKKDGKIRMCVDLRAPNQAVVTDSYPLP